ncbi:GNAT family N-acetyltransferase [Vogesella sp. LIG4]|uniref:GNAT family N-acetyltransferase n=1 Tax=Vogesella sp. LIG4 TaxID=1192162 RepID=UPI00138FA3AA|nr:GNAT family N-acetyltransferase [Vogesella sp. LIG4]
MLESQTAGHAAELFPLLADPALYAYIDQAPPASLDAFTARLRRLENRCSPDGCEQWLNWAIRLPEQGLAGYVQATVYADASADIAYVVGSRFQRRGIASEACRQMLNRLRAEHGVKRCYATVDRRNQASAALLHKLGFREASSHPHYAIEAGDALYLLEVQT